ncbi:MAG TPA: EamA family transporter [Jiangellales bacterium]|nr:EamA family transporter [Jiangellales bacterium]
MAIHISTGRELLGGGTSILLAATLWGTTGTVQTVILDTASPFSIGAARIVIGGMLLLVLASVVKRGAPVRRLLASSRTDRRRVRLLIALGALCVAVYQISFFASVATTGVAVGTVVTIGSGPAFAGVLATTLGNRPSSRWLLATTGAIVGCAALVSGGEAAGVVPVGVLLALVAGFGYAGYATIAGYLITKGDDDLAVIAALFAGAGFLLLPGLIATTPGWLLSPAGLTVALYLGGVTTTVGYVLYARGLRTTTVPTATTLTMAEPVVAALLGLIVLNEHLGTVALAGLGLIGVSLLLLVPRRNARSPATTER